MTKSILESKEYIWLKLPYHCHHWIKSGEELKQGKNLEAEADAEDIEGDAYRLTPKSKFSLDFYRTQDNLPRGGHIHNGQGLPKSITN